MKKIKKLQTYLFLSIFSLLLINGCKKEKNEPNPVAGPYFGQTPPGDTAVIFAPGIISLPDRREFRAAFSPDGKEFYFTVYFPNNTLKIYYTKLLNNTWTEQVVAPFSMSRNVSAPFISADGNKLYFTQSDANIENSSDIWMVERNDGGWGNPQILPSPINSTSDDGTYSETTNNVAYVSSYRPVGFSQNGDIWSIEQLNDLSLQAENIGPTVNTLGAWEPFVAPDESYLIFRSDRPGGYGIVDLYICFKTGDNEWSAPVNMEKCNAKINIANQHQLGASLSPDGKYLFFARHNSRGENFDIYWVSTSIIDTLKKIALPTK